MKELPGVCVCVCMHLVICAHKHFDADVSVYCIENHVQMSGRSVPFLAPYSLSPGDLNPVFQAMLEYTKQREVACCVACINRSEQMYFWLCTNAYLFEE